MLLICVLIFLHLLGDFYFQPNEMAINKVGNKNKKLPNIKWLLFHSLVYTVCFLPLVFMIPNIGFGFIVLLIVAGTHLIIDGITSFLKKKYDFSTLIFMIDQVLHSIFLIGAGHLIYYIYGFAPWGWLKHFEKYFEIMVCILLLIKPVSILINIIISDIDFNKSQSYVSEIPTSDKNNNNVSVENPSVNEMEDNKKKRFDPGAIIGVIERLLAFGLVLANSYAAIAIIITVKTWARQNDIKYVKGFGNKYLIGTLTSLTISIAIGYICTSVIMK